MARDKQEKSPLTVLTIPEVAEYLKISKDRVYVLVRSNAFPALKVGGVWRIPRECLDKWILEQIDDKYV